MREMLTIAVIGLAACASGGASGKTGNNTTPVAQTVRVSGQTGSTSTTLVTNDEAMTAAVPMTVDQAWRALPAVYEALGIPVTGVDPAKHSIGNDGTKIRRQLGKTALSRYIDCGSTQIGPSADTYEIYFTIHSQVAPDASGNAKVSTLVEALGKPVTFNQDYSRCTSTGTLEHRIIDSLAMRASR